MRMVIVAASIVLVLGAGCAPLGGEADWPPLAKKWYDRALASFRQADIEDAELAVGNALRLEPDREAVRVLAAKVALAQLDYDAAIQRLEGLETPEAMGIRGRAHWYAGRLEVAADELERLLADPEVRDPWAREVAKLARRGSGREPFRMSGSMLAVMEMPQVGGSALITPVELNGEPALGLIATGTSEVIMDSSNGRDPAWISLRFDDRVEVKDVPALTKDLSGLSRQLNAPIKLLLGVNLLRHIHPTIDYRGGQFVVRSFEPPPPPVSTTVPLTYIRGGGMVLRSGFGTDEETTASLLVDTALQYPAELDDAGWEKAGVPLASLQDVPNGGGLKHGIVPTMRFGAYSVPDVPAVLGATLSEYEKGLDVDLDGLVGAGLLGAFRVTIIDGGRAMWVEDMPIAETAAPPPAPETAPALPDEDDAMGPEMQLEDPTAG